MNINYNALFKFFIPYLLVILLAYIIASVFYFLVPTNRLEFSNNNSDVLQYKRFNISNAFKQEKQKITKEEKIVKKQEYSILNSVELIAIYSFSNNNGYIIIKEKTKSETMVLSSNEKFKNYTLKEVYSNYAIFEKNGKEYKLQMDESKDDNLTYEVVSNDETIKTTSSISMQDGQVSVKRELIDDYIKNFDKIWNDIAISEIKTENGIDGFRVNRIKKNTPFAKIGLQKGDIIKSINNVELKSYNDAFKIYKKINKLTSLNLVILRDNIETEIYYEIK